MSCSWRIPYWRNSGGKVAMLIGLGLLLALGMLPEHVAGAVDKCAKCNLPTSQGGCACNSNCDCVSSSSVNKCAKCNLPTSQGGCACNSNCDCVSSTSVNKCAKCNLPASQGGCACNSNCDCVSSTSDKCAKCNLPTNQGGCACNSNCDCVSSGGSGTSGCPAGWLPAVGTLFDSWPKPGSSECAGFNGCTWAGQFQTTNGGSGRSCVNGAQYINGGCRFPEATVRAWRVAATASTDRALLGRKLEVMVQNGAPGRTTTVNVIDVCSDSDCSGCCSQNTGRGKWKLIDIEKWPAYELLNNFNPNAANFDIGDVNAPMAGSLRPGAPGNSVMALCYRDVGKCDVAASSACK